MANRKLKKAPFSSLNASCENWQSINLVEATLPRCLSAAVDLSTRARLEDTLKASANGKASHSCRSAVVYHVSEPESTYLSSGNTDASSAVFTAEHPLYVLDKYKALDREAWREPVRPIGHRFMALRPEAKTTSNCPKSFCQSAAEDHGESKGSECSCSRPTTLNSLHCGEVASEAAMMAKQPVDRAGSGEHKLRPAHRHAFAAVFPGNDIIEDSTTSAGVCTEPVGSSTFTTLPALSGPEEDELPEHEGGTEGLKEGSLCSQFGEIKCSVEKEQKSVECSGPATISMYGPDVESNDPSFSPFHSSHAPSISLRDYFLGRIVKYTQMTSTDFVLAVIFINKLLRVRQPVAHDIPNETINRSLGAENSSFHQGASRVSNRLTQIESSVEDRMSQVVAKDEGIEYNVLTAHRLLLTACLIANKVHYDRGIVLKHWAKLGGLELEEAVNLEATFLKIIDWRVKVSVEEFILVSTVHNECVYMFISCRRARAFHKPWKKCSRAFLQKHAMLQCSSR
ncbi:hypothetical protein BESB_015400 [Besnoitia besnoiti]|uniref:Cyclin n=1 Tax=Besnoitia besnoiti TaxID=94643 RepID=A0A2A9MBD2_BESBE|nr:hypothetical protein BESB_015400 [Besnoitia besnoiti]PFH32927.1 hypothetical protein BESB_015400 [Besnoitia besnoiti]